MAIRRNLSPVYFLSLGTVLRLQGRYDDVLRVVDKTVQLGFDDARLWMLCGQTMVDLKRPYDALLSSQQVLKFEPLH